MIIRPRVQRLLLSRLLKILLVLTLAWTAYEVWSIRHALAEQASKEPPPFGKQRIFIASIHWTDERILREYWVPAVLQLAQDIGRENVFVSVYESGSFDDTKGALQELEDHLARMGIDHKVVLDDTTHLNEVSRERAEVGWVQMPSTKTYRQNWTDWFSLQKDEWVPRRIPYLARLRNQVMEPLYEQQQLGNVYDKILWLNDVVFDTEDVQRLLGTRDGHYAAACALDFKRAPAFYDTFALRDAAGYAPLTDTWPFFRSAESRNAIVYGRPVPVASCWNGMVVFDAKPFYRIVDRLAFRGISDTLAASHLEGSECCLVHADNPLSHEKGVWVNPNVRVGYNGTAYHAVNDGHVWPSSYAIMTGVWQNRITRWLRVFSTPDRIVEGKLRAAEQWAPDTTEPDKFCLIDEMQILLWNGWGHA
ncbi:hypothetical protein LTS12_023783 [Elasticomyces elasticus]|nr:hypothetical protein LTS12_023783 [Elasticomyces elasticus]